MKGMKYTEAALGSIEEFIEGEYAMAQKLDGCRLMVHIHPEGILFKGVGDEVVKFAAATQHFPALRERFEPLVAAGRTLVIDGELIIESGEFFAFDLPYDAQQGIKPETGFAHRYLSLVFLAPFVQRVPVAFSPVEKRALWESVIERNIEGVIVRPVDSPYLIGRRSTEVRKVKVVKTADVIITASSRGRNDAGRETGAFTLAVYNPDGSLRTVGACSAIGKPPVEVGDVIEVAFLYATESLTLYQPRMVRYREDKAPIDCGIEQVTQFITSREVIGA